MDQFRTKFIEEAGDLINELEKNLLILEHDTETQVIEEVFRAMHTLKGSSAMFGFELIGHLTHHLETIYDHVREGTLSVSQQLLDLTLNAVDHIRDLLNEKGTPGGQILQRHEQLSGQIARFVDQAGILNAPASEPEPDTAMEEPPGDVTTYYILFRPDRAIMGNGTNPLYLVDDLHFLGKCKAIAHIEEIPELLQISPTACYTYWEVYLATREDINAIKDIFIFVIDDCVLNVQLLATEDLFKYNEFSQWIEEKAQIAQAVELHELQQFSADLVQKYSGAAVIEETLLVTDPTVATPTAKKEHVISSIRVPSQKLDQLMNLVSELVTTQARLSLLAEKTLHPELVGVAEEVEKLSRQLRDITFDICLVPIDTLFTRFQRLIRDLSAELKKDIVLIEEGGDTELDKNIIENLADPLLHILRNSADHGIEPVAVRQQLGKPAQGRITIKAFYSGTHVYIQVRDDGAGLNAQKIRDRAISRRLISPEAVLTEKELYNLIFLPGFTTTDKVTEVSGRGVGMDVVRRKIADLRGEIDMDSRPNQGTTITIKLPLTLSIIDGLLVKVDDNHFVIPLSVVDKCYEVPHTQIARVFNNRLVLDGELIPFFYLREEFNITENCPAVEQAIVIEFDHKRVGLVVDVVIGKYQAVLKPLGRVYKNLQIISGATVLGDGTIALVMDTNKMVQQFVTT